MQTSEYKVLVTKPTMITTQKGKFSSQKRTYFTKIKPVLLSERGSLGRQNGLFGVFKGYLLENNHAF